MLKLKTSLAVAVLLGLMLIAAPAASADAMRGDAQSTVLCSTWQYVTDPGMPIYFGPGTSSGRKETTRNQGFVNVRSFSGDWRGGNFYTDPRTRVVHQRLDSHQPHSLRSLLVGRPVLRRPPVSR